ncbi:MAG: FRG domain-containing protein [Bacteroidia bacterium]
MEKITAFNNDFAKIESIHTFHTGLSLPVFEIASYHTLIQFIGYAKYLNRTLGNVYLRGQHNLYNNLIPTIFRNISTTGGFHNRNKHIGEFVNECADHMQFINELDDIVREPILQHYGIRTRWIDLVDNVWVAIWFGVHTWHTRIFDREYKNVIPRQTGPEEFLYLLLVCSDGIHEDANVPGLYKGANTYTVDLRKAAPSIFLRPHAQHALLIRSKHLETVEHTDLANYIVGIAKVKLEDGIHWIGTNGLTSARSLFPPVNFDHGYGVLIEQTPHNKMFVRDYGSIYSITY